MVIDIFSNLISDSVIRLFSKKVVEKGIPILTRPTNWEFFHLVNVKNNLSMMSTFESVFDITKALLGFILEGELDRFQSLRIIMLSRIRGDRTDQQGL